MTRDEYSFKNVEYSEQHLDQLYRDAAADHTFYAKYRPQDGGLSLWTNGPEPLMLALQVLFGFGNVAYRVEDGQYTFNVTEGKSGLPTVIDFGERLRKAYKDLGNTDRVYWIGKELRSRTSYRLKQC